MRELSSQHSFFGPILRVIKQVQSVLKQNSWFRLKGVVPGIQSLVHLVEPSESREHNADGLKTVISINKAEV